MSRTITIGATSQGTKGIAAAQHPSSEDVSSVDARVIEDAAYFLYYLRMTSAAYLPF